MTLSTLAHLPDELAVTNARVPVHIETDRTLRIKIIDSCGLACTFCHNEGTPVESDNRSRRPERFTSAGRSGRASIYLSTNGSRFIATATPDDDSFTDMLRAMKSALDLREVHFTGGEPSLHHRLPGLIARATREGLTVGLTSNGEHFAPKAAACAAAGLDRVNFSVFGTTPAELAAVQGGRLTNPMLAARKITALDEAIESSLSQGIKTSANLVVPGPGHIDRVRLLIERHAPQLTIRLLNSLADGQAAIDAIMRVIAELEAVPVCHRLTAGSSSARTDYRLPGGRRLAFKQIRPARLPRTCEGCRWNNPSDCEEDFYGVRVYRDQVGTWQVGVCVQRMDLCQPLDTFIGGRLCEEVLELRDDECGKLVGRYGN